MNLSMLFHQAIQDARKIVISTHIIPDADGLGSQIALIKCLKLLGKQALGLNQESLPARFHYLDPEKEILSLKQFESQAFEYDDIDLFIIVDTNSLDRIGQVSEIAQKSKQVLFIDHHPYSSPIEGEHCIDTSKAATGELVADIILKLNLPLTPFMANALYTSILVDTSCFRYPNVTWQTHEVTAKLLKQGIPSHKAYNLAYGSKKIEHLHLLSDILKTAQANATGEISWIVLSEELIKRYNSRVDDTHSFINHLLILDQIKIACMFRFSPRLIKLSLRSKGNWDVGSIAQKLGGGGHGHAAAVRFSREEFKEFSQSEIIQKIISQIEQSLGAS